MNFTISLVRRVYRYFSLFRSINPHTGPETLAFGAVKPVVRRSSEAARKRLGRLPNALTTVNSITSCEVIIQNVRRNSNFSLRKDAARKCQLLVSSRAKAVRAFHSSKAFTKPNDELRILNFRMRTLCNQRLCGGRASHSVGLRKVSPQIVCRNFVVFIFARLRCFRPAFG